MNSDKELMQMALDALELVTDLTNHDDEVYAAIEALRARLAQPEPEPWGYISHKSWKMPVFVEADDLQAANLPFNNPDYTPVYKAPPQREWQGLTDEEIENCFEMSMFGTCRAIEAKLKAKNHD